MPRAAERHAASIARDDVQGWILVEHPAAHPGWYPVRRVILIPGWVMIACGRGTDYVVPSRSDLWWSPVEPPATWWLPW